MVRCYRRRSSAYHARLADTLGECHVAPDFAACSNSGAFMPSPLHCPRRHFVEVVASPGRSCPGPCPGKPATGGQSAIGDEKRDTEPKFCERSASLIGNIDEMSLPVGKSHSSIQSEPELDKPASIRQFASARRDDQSCLTKVVTIPGGTSSVDATGNHGQDQRAEDSRESEPLPETLEVCWVEPSDHCETGQSPSKEKSGGTCPSDEEEGLGSVRSPAGGHLLSAGG